jgi:acetamidase/formamidase
VEHVLEPGDRTLHGHFSAQYPPVLTVRPGDSVTFRTLDCWWSAGPYAGEHPPDRPRVPQHRPEYGHALVGPIEVLGARAGQTLEVRVDAVVPATWGTTVAGGWPSGPNRRYHLEHEGVVHAWTLDPAAMTGRNQHGHTVPLRPFLGVMGMPPAEPGRHSTIPPRTCGGNLDCRELTAGSTLWLPIEVDGALFSCGDGHAAQGDGEVSGTAIECPMERAELTFSLSELPLATPIARGPDGAWITLGVHEDLDEAAVIALDAMLALLGREFGLSRRDALAVASVSVDLRVTQMVNLVRGVHAVLRGFGEPVQ